MAIFNKFWKKETGRESAQIQPQTDTKSELDVHQHDNNVIPRQLQPVTQQQPPQQMPPPAMMKIASLIQQSTPTLDALGLDKSWRQQFLMKAGLQMVKGNFNLGSLMTGFEQPKQSKVQKIISAVKDAWILFPLTLLTLLIFKAASKWLGV